jgi:hypothetical protein
MNGDGMSLPYEPPTVSDLGDLVELTAACVGGGAADETFKGNADPFQNVSPAFGDPSFCTP